MSLGRFFSYDIKKVTIQRVHVKWRWMAAKDMEHRYGKGTIYETDEGGKRFL